MTSVYGRQGEIQWIKNISQLQVVIIIMAADLWKKMQVNLVKEPNNDFDKELEDDAESEIIFGLERESVGRVQE